MAVPARPVSGNVIDSAWGQVVHDTTVAQDIQVGTVAVPVTNAANAALAVVFPRPFAAPPTVLIAQNANSAAWFAYISGVTAAQFLANVTTKAGTTATATITCTWIAVGPRA